jgi:hypothetical protein
MQIQKCLLITRDFIKLEKWLSHNRLILNAKKTNGMFISNGERSNPSFNSIFVNLSGIPIPFVQPYIKFSSTCKENMPTNYI